MCIRDRAHIVRSLTEGTFANGISNRHFGELELACCVVKPESKTWHACRLLGADQGRSIQPNEFQKTLSEEMALYFRQHTTVRSIAGVTWARIAIEEEGWRGNKPQSVLVAHHPRASFVLHTSTTNLRRKYLLGALQAIFQCTAVQPELLITRDMRSLVSMCLQQHGRWGAASLAAHAGSKDNPLAADQQHTRSNKKRKSTAAADQRRSKLVSEEVALHAKRSEQADAACGVGEQPAALQRVDFKLKGSLRGSDQLGCDGSFPMLVRFDGPNVLAGVKQMVAAGVVSMPMPAVLDTLLERPSAQVEI
eukprot:TRINITY_DN22459_c0_g1_i2.p1 TRINITY_DN22459_c0_g1~~TRINITY_DN22459_c0_g1_i2.p1  ORF type:complete len:307 (+),score=99.71 TRINITY_DN22459_c0_g1_i2:131-1051(+)